MRYRICPYDGAHFASGLRFDNHNKRLIWDSAQGQSVIIVRTLFGVEGTSILPELCEALNRYGELPTEYSEVMSDVSVCYLTAVDKARNGGCHLNGQACTYSIFSCQVEADECKIYETNLQSMYPNTCSIPMEIHVEVLKDTVYKKGLFKRHEVETGFYFMTFRTEQSSDYLDGSLAYLVNGLEIPVTVEMIEQQTIFIKTEEKPELITKNNGIKLV